MTNITNAVNICNLSLGHLGITQSVANIESPNTKEERICSLYYDITRQSVLESYNWNFAKDRILVSASTTTPAFKWQYQSTDLPSDLLTVLGLWDSNGYFLINTNRRYYELEGNKILTNLAGPYRISYIKDITDVSQMSRLFIMLFSYTFAITLYKALGASGTTLQALQALYEIWEAKAVSINQRQSPPVVVSKSPYLDERRVAGGSGETRWYNA